MHSSEKISKVLQLNHWWFGMQKFLDLGGIGQLIRKFYLCQYKCCLVRTGVVVVNWLWWCISGAMGCTSGRGGGMWRSQTRGTWCWCYGTATAHRAGATPVRPASPSNAGRSLLPAKLIDTPVHVPAAHGRVGLQVLFNFHSATIILQQPVAKGWVVGFIINLWQARTNQPPLFEVASIVSPKRETQSLRDFRKF